MLYSSFQEAEVQVSPKSGMYGDTPYTIQAGGCGTPGDHIHLTPEYVKTVNQSKNVETYGPSGKSNQCIFKSNKQFNACQ